MVEHPRSEDSRNKRAGHEDPLRDDPVKAGRESGGIASRTQRIELAPAENYRGTFAPQLPELSEGDPLPPGWEGLYFPFASSMEGLRPDGTPEDDVLPRIELPRRMYAGEDTVFHRPIRMGETVEQRVRAGRIIEKNGKRGRLVFADIERQYLVDGELAVESLWHDVFLESSGPAAARSPERAPARIRRHRLDSRHLFRFSAITFNTHRVHYDRRWAQQEEGLEDLLIHGPLTRMLLLDAALRPLSAQEGRPGDCPAGQSPAGQDGRSGQRAVPGGGHPGRRPRSCSFTATAPLFVDRELTVGVTDDPGSCEAVALNEEGHLAARALVEW